MMDNAQMEALLAEYLSDETDPRRRRELRDRLLANGYDASSLADWEAFSKDLGSIPVPQPGPAMTQGFYRKLETFKQTHARNGHRWIHRLSRARHPISGTRLPRLVYAFCLVAIGWFLGYAMTSGERYADEMAKMTAQMHEMKEMFTLTLLEQPSPAERIRAVNLVEALDDTDLKIIEALMQTLNGDPNINVRLVTVEQLARFTHLPSVREGLIRSIANQDAPIVQLALADLMVALRERRSVDALQQLLDRKDLKYSVKTHIEASLSKLAG